MGALGFGWWLLFLYTKRVGGRSGKSPSLGQVEGGGKVFLKNTNKTGGGEGEWGGMVAMRESMFQIFRKNSKMKIRHI